jgi:hypothetical protein
MPLPSSRRKVCALATPELFVLCSLRLIARAARGVRATEKLCGEGFALARLPPDDMWRLAAALKAMEAAAGRPLGIGDLCSAEVSADEDLVLQLVVLMQHDDAFGARRVLGTLLPPAAARTVLGHLEVLAHDMAGAGLRLSQLPYALRPCPAEPLAARRLGALRGGETSETPWLN